MTSGKIRLLAGVTETPQYGRRAPLTLTPSKREIGSVLGAERSLAEIAELIVQAEPDDIEAIVAGKGRDRRRRIGEMPEAREQILDFPRPILIDHAFDAGARRPTGLAVPRAADDAVTRENARMRESRTPGRIEQILPIGVAETRARRSQRIEFRRAAAAAGHELA